MPTPEAKAAQLLKGLCDDILDIQIGTLMVWDEAGLREDRFAQYVHHWLLDASRRMGCTHYDSSKVWEGLK